MPPTPRPIIYDPVQLASSDRISPTEAAALIGISRSDVYRLIRVLERYVEPGSGEIRDLPPAYRALKDQRERNAWRREHTVVIPDWGAESLGHADWRISRMRLKAWLLTNRRSVPALLSATAPLSRTRRQD